MLLLGGCDPVLLPRLYAVRLNRVSDRTHSAGVQNCRDRSVVASRSADSVETRADQSAQLSGMAIYHQSAGADKVAILTLEPPVKILSGLYTSAISSISNQETKLRLETIQNTVTSRCEGRGMEFLRSTGTQGATVVPQKYAYFRIKARCRARQSHLLCNCHCGSSWAGSGKMKQEVAGDVSMGHSQPHTISAAN